MLGFKALAEDAKEVIALDEDVAKQAITDAEHPDDYPRAFTTLAREKAGPYIPTLFSSTSVSWSSEAG